MKHDFISEKENYLRALTQNNPQYTAGPTALINFGFSSAIEKGDKGGDGIDGFGVRWHRNIPEARNFVLTDIGSFRQQVRFPDISKYDFAAEYEHHSAELAERNEKVFVYGNGNGIFERIVALCGFAYAFYAMYEKPECVRELAEAIADYKISLVKHIYAMYQPDVWCSYDDVATATGLFIPPEIYRRTIKPATARYFYEIKRLGMLPVQHVCGKWGELIEDYIDMGACAVSSVQPCNDICGLLRKYSDKISLIGGYDTSGRCGSAQYANEALVRNEVRRCMLQYAPVSGSYIFGGFVIDRLALVSGESSPSATHFHSIMLDEYKKFIP